jgi:hypothetical protein
MHASGNRSGTTYLAQHDRLFVERATLSTANATALMRDLDGHDCGA